jgi:ATP-dependent protease ClpP protease subunit
MNKVENIKMNNSGAKNYHGYNMPQEYNVSFFPHKSGVYKIEIDSAIESVSQFSTAIQVLDMAKEDDQVEIHLSCCPGGSVDAGDTFIHSMKKCQAPIHIIASGGTHSMATQILMCADSFELSDSFNSLIHAGQDGSYGTVPEYHAKSAFDLEFRTRKFKEAYKHFLTDVEIENVLKGQDLWLDGKAWYERAAKASELYKAEYEAIMNPVQVKVSKPRNKKPLTLVPENKAA